MAEPRAIAEAFALDGPVAACEVCQAGNINLTAFITTETGRRYVLQKINDHVFVDPHAVMANVEGVVDHVMRVAPGLVAPLVHARQGGVVVERDGVWRMLEFVEGRSVRRLTAAQAEAAGEAFGRFQSALAGFAAPLAVAIDNFHNFAHQLERLDEVIDLSPGRLPDAEPLVARVAALRRVETPKMVPGIIHGDCKVDNLLFEQDRVSAVLDLDTVMHGNRVWDFGDLVRSASAAAEDGSVPSFDLARFAAIARGFARGLGELATPALRAAMPAAPGYMTLMLAVRFLVDYLEGDRYFQTDSPGHNLRRAETQLNLAELMADKLDAMHEITEHLTP